MPNTNYNKMFENDKEPIAKTETPAEKAEQNAPMAKETKPEIKKETETVTTSVESVAPETKKPETKPSKAVVFNCSKLNVRERPSSLASVLTTVNAGDEVVVDESKSNGKFYSVTTATGIEGYCVKDYLKMK